MRKRDKAGLLMGPLLLRLVLGVTFLWAGLGKVVDRMEVSGENAAILANLGVIKAPSGQPTAPFEGGGETGEDIGGEDVGFGGSIESSTRLVGFQSGVQYSAANFREPVSTRKVNGLVLAMYKASHPGFDADNGQKLRPIWPKALGEGQTVQILAWLVALGEILCGAGVLVGLLTRLGGFGLFTIMAGAVWLTQIGPAIQSGSTSLGFLPAHDPWATDAWKDLLWQVSLMGSSLALVFLGAGSLSLDALLFRPKSKDPGDFDEDDDDSDD